MISIAHRRQKIANLEKPVTSLIIVQFSIREKFWKALGLLYQPREISARNKMCETICGVCAVFKTPHCGVY